MDAESNHATLSTSGFWSSVLDGGESCISNIMTASTFFRVPISCSRGKSAQLVPRGHTEIPQSFSTAVWYPMQNELLEELRVVKECLSSLYSNWTVLQLPIYRGQSATTSLPQFSRNQKPNQDGQDYDAHYQNIWASPRRGIG